MRYYVVGRDGRKYGPADAGTLAAWALEGRVLPDTLLEDEVTGRPVRAAEVVGLRFPPPGATPAPTDWSKPPEYGVGNTVPQTSTPGASDLALAWVFSILSMVLCFAYGCLSLLLGPIALVFANRAQSLGQNAQGPKVLAWISIVLSLLFIVGIALVLILAAAGG